MKCLLSALLTCCASSIAEAVTLKSGALLSPVSRVAELLQGLSKKIETEGQAEEELYNKYVCWAKTVMDQKGKANTEAESRKESLEAYVKDIEAGRIEFTTERVDLEKEIAGLTADLEEAGGLRTKENQDFEAAETEMKQAIAALSKAIEVLEPASGAGGAALLRVRSRSKSEQRGFQARQADVQALVLASQLASRSLSAADSQFLQRVLFGDVPVKDWKKLNKKPTFKEKYERRSGDILGVLKKLQRQFEDSLTSAQHKETEAVKTHEALTKAKGGQKDTAELALSEMEVEGAARGLSKSEATSEIAALTTQVEEDTKYISETQAALDAKKVEWSERSTIRQNEIEAISKALSIIHSDDARDLFKKSISSQGYFFLQEVRAHGKLTSATAAEADLLTPARRARAAVAALQRAGLSQLARQASRSQGQFDVVIEAVDKMLAQLQEQETTDLATKEKCETARATDTREASLVSRSMDDLTDGVTRLQAEISEIQTQIEEKNTTIAEIWEQLKTAARNRKDENAAWVQTDKDDADAAALIEKAVAVLEDFYKNLQLVQQRKRAPTVVAGEAPPPPPSTWEGGYAGKKDEEAGVTAILGLIKEDIEKDRETATAAETAAQTAYDAFKTESEAQMGELVTSISELSGVIGEKEGKVVEATDDRSGKQQSLTATMTQIEATAKECDFFTVNFQVRVKARQLEADGLHKAKAVLSGASFE